MKTYFITKISVMCLALFTLSFFASCGGDGEGSPGTFDFVVYNGEFDNGTSDPDKIEGATVEVYTSYESYVNGDSPLKTFTTDVNGRVETNDLFPATAVVYAESGNFDNWPNINEMSSDPSITGRLQGSTSVYRSFKSDFESILSKKFVITDAILNGTSLFSNVADCSKDNYFQMELSKEFLYSEGSSVCDGQPASTDHEFLSIGKKSTQSQTVINGESTYSFFSTWEGSFPYLYMSEDFERCYTKESTANGELIYKYTAQ